MSLAQFEVLNKLGEGAYSCVFKVKRKTDGLTYALKKVKFGNLTSREKQNALNEIRILASINHPNIIAYKEAFIDEHTSTLCIVMELADGGDLLKKIHKHKAAGVPMPEKDIWDIIIQLVRGLKTLHEMNILHRDMKSSNIFLCRDGTVKIGDLNVSKIADQGLVYTQTGTPYYASPEVWRDRPYDLKSDMWSLGCVVYEMAAQQPPFRAKDMESLFKRVVRGLYSELPSTYSNDLSNLVRSLLQVKPSLRPSCDQVLQLPLMSRNLNSSRQAEVQSESNHGLIETIKLPPSLRSLSSKLPAAKYERNLSACSPLIGCDNKENIFRSRNHSRDSARRFTGHKPEVRVPLGERKNHGLKIDDVKLPPIFNSSIFRK